MQKLALALVLFAGCATPVHEGSCGKNLACPSGFLCGSDGECHPGSGDGFTGDGSCGASCKCTSDGQCGGANPRCDLADGKCVPCLPTNDNCKKGSSCETVNGGYQCVTGCNADKDCAAQGDAGAQKLECCNHLCSDVFHDDKNCGSCGATCGQMTCCAGACLDATKDPMNCGACGKTCSGDNANWTCANSACAVTGCNTGYGDCNMVASDGCEAALGNDPNNCGMCGMKCAAPNAGTSCVLSACTLTNCNAGFGDCDKVVANGCEANLASDPNNCGGCGTKCGNVPNAMATCMGSKCVLTQCNNGFADCDKNPANGCEADLSNDPSNCGSCGMKCGAVANATVGCSAEKCVITGCTVGFGDCDKQYANGCEKDVSSDINNCGQCGMVCANGPNVATMNCSLSSCRIASCNNGFADCNKVIGDGCEINITNDPNNCFGCGSKCMVNQSCVNSLCTNSKSYIGQFNVQNGPNWQTNPQSVSCTQECALMFGAGVYSCSTSFAFVNNQAWASAYADVSHCNINGGTPVGESYKLGGGYDCGAFDCSYSAYVMDNCTDGQSINYCWK